MPSSGVTLLKSSLLSAIAVLLTLSLATLLTCFHPPVSAQEFGKCPDHSLG